MTNEPQVVILGAGFGGLGAIKELEKTPAKVTLIDRNDYHTFLPLLYQVATSELGPSEVAFPARELLHGHENFVFHQADVTGIDLDAKQISFEDMDPISYDYLVIGLGGVVNFFGTKGAAESAFPLYTLDDALRLKSRILQCLEAADRDPSLIDDGALRFCVVGGGATGVEISGALAELLKNELEKDYPNLPMDKAEVHLYEMGPSLLSPFKSNLQEYAQKSLEQRHVHVHLGEGVGEIEPTCIHLKSGNIVKTHTLIWGAGLTANPIAQALGSQLTRGRVVVGPELGLEGHPEVFVIGDIALITDSKTKQQLPQLGSVAQQAGHCAGENIDLMVRNQPPKPFVYVDKGTMATIGHGAAIMQLQSGKTMRGRAAWLAWLGVHLMLLSGGDQKAHTFVDWGWGTITKGRSKRVDSM